MRTIESILSKYSLTRETATLYIETITHKNQTQTAKEIGVSRDTINRYKNAFDQMEPDERARLIAALLQDRLIARIEEK